MSVERYRGIIPEWEAFSAALARPEPVTLRVRMGRVDPGELLERLRRQGFTFGPDPLVPGFLRVEGSPFPLSETLEHWLGLFYIQQSVTGVAAPLLDPRPGERVLDLCAAPGGKSSHLAERMEDRGCLVAVEPVDSRMRALVGNVARLAHPSMILVGGDALDLPETARFDRILADVPCSGEGRIRRSPGGGPAPAPRRIREFAGLQTELLRKAVRLLRPGGRVLYVTCTFAPEENEGVVDRVLGEGGVRLVPLSPDLPHSPGVTTFEGARWAPELEGACRILPHHLDSGGLFLALLERLPEGEGESDPTAGWTPVLPALPTDPPPPDPEGKIGEAIRILTEELGVPAERIAPWRWVVRGDDVRMHGMSDWPLEEWRDRRGVRVVSLGLRALSPGAKGRLRPSTDLLRWLGSSSLERRLELGEEEWRRLLSGAELRRTGVPDGYVALALDGAPIAGGRVRRGRVFHELSPGRAGWLGAVLDRRRGSG